jgi:twitching motility protein PilU
MKRSREQGLQTFDMSLFDLYEAGKISYEDALRSADSMNELRLAIKLEGHEAQGRDPFAETDGLSILGDGDSDLLDSTLFSETLTNSAMIDGLPHPDNGGKS